MRILYISHTHPPKGAILDNVGGMQRVSKQLVGELMLKEAVEINTETTNVSGKGQVVFSTFWFLLRQFFFLPKRVRETKPDVVLFSSMVTASLAFFLRNRIAVPMITISHGRDVTLPLKIYQWFLPKVFEKLDGVISVSRATRKECIKRGMDPEKGIALPNGFDFNKLEQFPDKNESRRELEQQFGIPLENKFLLLSVGRKVKRKGHEWFIRNVLPKLEKNVVYVTIGDGPEFENISKAVQQSELKDRIFLLGRQSDDILKKAYAAADLFIMPNIPIEGDMEGFGIVMLEANMAHTPAVASDLEGIKDVIEQGKNGYRIPPLEADEFAEQINNTLIYELEKLSLDTRSHVQEQFSWHKVADAYVDFFRRILSRKA